MRPERKPPREWPARDDEEVELECLRLPPRGLARLLALASREPARFRAVTAGPHGRVERRSGPLARLVPPQDGRRVAGRGEVLRRPGARRAGGDAGRHQLGRAAAGAGLVPAPRPAPDQPAPLALSAPAWRTGRAAPAPSSGIAGDKQCAPGAGSWMGCPQRPGTGRPTGVPHACRRPAAGPLPRAIRTGRPAPAARVDRGAQGPSHTHGHGPGGRLPGARGRPVPQGIHRSHGTGGTHGTLGQESPAPAPRRSIHRRCHAHRRCHVSLATFTACAARRPRTPSGALCHGGSSSAALDDLFSCRRTAWAAARSGFGTRARGAPGGTAPGGTGRTGAGSWLWTDDHRRRGVAGRLDTRGTGHTLRGVHHPACPGPAPLGRAQRAQRNDTRQG